MKNFPVEVQLDILKFFDYKQLYSFQLINKQLNKLINKYNNELALKEFFGLEMIPDTRVFHAERKRALDIAKDFEKRYGNEIIYNFELTDRQKIKWVNALIANVPLLIYPYAKEQSLDSIDDTYILFIRREGNPTHYYYKGLDEIKLNFELNMQQIEMYRKHMLISQRRREFKRELKILPYYRTENYIPRIKIERYRQLCLELPLYPKTIEELKFIRFWLFQLTRCCFNYIDFEDVFFNPEMLKILFEDSEDQTNKFNHFCCLNIILSIGDKYTSNTSVKNEKRSLDFATNYLNINGNLILKAIQTFHEEFLYLLLNSGNKIKEMNIFDFYLPIELHNILIKHAETSPKASKMVSQISFIIYNNNMALPTFGPNSIKIKEENLKIVLKTEYKIKNENGPKTECFYVVYTHKENEAKNDRIITTFKIKRINYS